MTQPDILASVYETIRDDLKNVDKTLKKLADNDPSLLSEVLNYILKTTGKRIRPAITLLASHFHRQGGETIGLMASAIELLHIATLIHDDTVDNSSLRRGHATISSMWGDNTAVLVGDYIFATSATFVCDTGNIRVVKRFAETIMELSSGQLAEMSRAYDISLTREDYFERIYQKTASLFTTASESGAILGGSPEKTVEALRNYGLNLGIAYQISDDILDFEGTSKEIGKPIGSDLSHGILTLPAIIALERNPKNNPIEYYCRQSGDQVALQEALAMIQDKSIIEESYSVADGFSVKALETLESLESNEAKLALKELVPYLVRRRS
tara:strand:+ start:13713 stop:14690 length:978 start_codon:yes stop_codon:yes gene_type:complete